MNDFAVFAQHIIDYLSYMGNALLYTNMPTLIFSHDNPYTEDDFKGAFSTDTLAF